MGDHFAQILHLQQDTLPKVGGGHWWKLLSVNALDVVIEGTGPNVEGLGAKGELHLDLVGGESVDQVHKRPGGDGCGPFLDDLGPNPAGDPQLEIGAGKAQPAVLGGHQNIGQHRQRAARRDGPGHGGQPMSEVFLQDGELHFGCNREVYPAVWVL